MSGPVADLDKIHLKLEEKWRMMGSRAKVLDTETSANSPPASGTKTTLKLKPVIPERKNPRNEEPQRG